jgi:hypothetical protein
MQYTFAKRYPLIGIPEPIPVEDVPYLNPVTGLIPLAGEMTAINKVDGMSLLNIKNEYFLIIVNTDVDDPLTVTIAVPVTIAGYDAIPPVITIPAEGTVIVGPFSTNFHDIDGLVQLTFGGASDGGLIMVGRLP